jgi:hypothetical protein
VPSSLTNHANLTAGGTKSTAFHVIRFHANLRSLVPERFYWI